MRLFRALADTNRLHIVSLLASGGRTKKGAGEIGASEMLTRFSFSQPTLSHHMKILFEAGLVLRHRDGKNMHYTLDTNGIAKLSGFIESLRRDE
ncbi:MAG: metalloregulator ArsR/SmtB family transcription factor [Treponema sp.]|jgi:ArsR family transcriptional regulator|nr:metalloregulator ArsR/SmtB family transcription factor [Treponema sp.]